MKPPLGLSTALVLLWAFGYPLGALGVSAMSPMLLITLRFAGSGLAMLALAIVTGRRFPRGRMLGHVMVLGILTQAAQFGCAYLALSLGTPAVIVALVIALNPLATTLLAWPILGTRVTRTGLSAVLVGTAAVVVTCLPRIVAHPGSMSIAVGLVLLALLGVALGGIYQQKFCTGVDLVASNATQLLVATVPVGIITLLTPQTITDPVRAAWVLPTMIVASSMVATTLLLRLVNIAGAAVTSMLFTIIPSVAALMSWAMLGQRPDAGIVIGLVLGGVALLISGRGSSRGSAKTAKTPLEFDASVNNR